MVALLEYIDCLLQLVKSVEMILHMFHYAGIMLNAFSDPLC